MATIPLQPTESVQYTLPTSTKIEFVDSHCHFDFSEFDYDRDTVWQECLNKNVSAMIVPGIEPAQWPRLTQLSKQYVGLFYAVGIHPWWLEKLFPEVITPAELETVKHQLRKNSSVLGCVAIGECGLDAMIDQPLIEQIKILRVHVQLASELSLPLILHCRKTHNELITLLKQHNLRAGGVVHGFSGSIETALQYWSMGFYLGIGGTITYERANKTRTAVKKLPIEAIVLETDAPDMPLAGKQGTRNTPTSIPLGAKTLAGLRGESLEIIANKTTENARRLFQIGRY